MKLLSADDLSKQEPGESVQCFLPHGAADRESFSGDGDFCSGDLFYGAGIDRVAVVDTDKLFGQPFHDRIQLPVERGIHTPADHMHQPFFAVKIVNAAEGDPENSIWAFKGKGRAVLFV